ncbi:MAG: epoxyqueuosine reductase QueH [Culturomica sp.]|nr:epoxyqueuosine reductase QueH [Culturomica sp.]
MQSLLLHTCCAPCSAAVIEWLLQNDIRPVLYYFNPNIFPLAEYERRKNECTRYAERSGLEVVDGDYEHNVWLEGTKGLEEEPERGRRCLYCFQMRLLATARTAQERGIACFATTLASSRWKNLSQIGEAGRGAAARVPGTEFWEKNWRAGGLSERRRLLLQENSFYNQRYCGCEFSRK